MLMITKNFCYIHKPYVYVIMIVNAVCKIFTVQLKGNIALACYCLARFSKTIHSILDTHQRSFAVYRVLNHSNQPRDLFIDNSLENYHSRDDLITA